MASRMGKSIAWRTRVGAYENHVKEVDLWSVLPVLGAMDVVLLCLSLFVLGVGARPNTALALEACGWSPSALTTECILAVYALCFSFFLVGAQLITLGAAGKSVDALHGPLRRHVFLPLFGTAVGGAISAHSLWGTAAASSGDCSHLSQSLFIVTVVVSYGLAAYYAVLSCRLSRNAAKPCEKLGEAHATNDATSLVPLAPSCANTDALCGGDAAERSRPPILADAPCAVIAKASSWHVSLAAAEEGHRGSPHVVSSAGGISDSIRHARPDDIGNTAAPGGSQGKTCKPGRSAPLDDVQPPLCIGVADGPWTSKVSPPRHGASETDTEVPTVSTIFKTKKSQSDIERKRDQVESPSPNESIVPSSDSFKREPDSNPKHVSEGSTELGVESDLSFRGFEVRIQQPTSSSSKGSFSQLDVPSPSGSFKLSTTGGGERSSSKDSSGKKGSKESSGVPPPPQPFGGTRPKRGCSDGSKSRRGSMEGPGSRRGSMEGPASKRGSMQGPGSKRGSMEGTRSRRGSMEGPGSRRGSTEAVKRSSLGTAGQLPSRDPVGRPQRMSKIDMKFEHVFAVRRSLIFDTSDTVAFENAQAPSTAEADAAIALKRVVGTAAPADPHPHSSVAAISEEEAPAIIGDDNAMFNEDSEAESGDDWEPTELSVFATSSEPVPKRCSGSILVTSSQRLSNLNRQRKSVSIKLAEGMASGSNSRRQSQNGRGSLLDMQVIHYATSPINFNLMVPVAGVENEDSQSRSEVSSPEDSSDFHGPPGQEIEVPFWLLDRERAENSKVGDPEESENAATSHEESEDDCKDEETYTYTVNEPNMPMSRVASSEDALKRVSFNHGPETKKKTSKNESPSGSFWKIPMPTRKNTIMHPEGDARGEAQRIHSKSSDHLAPPALPGPPTRRPSALGLFANDGVKDVGLYALANDQAGVGNNNAVVEVKRSSIILSTSILKEVLQSKVDTERLTEIEDSVEEDDQFNDEVVLPFFTTAKSALRKCQCSTDPVTGLVIHTCMTPATTRENTETLNSFVCSAWGSRWGSRGGSRRNSGQKKKNFNSGWSEDSEEEEEEKLELGFKSKSDGASAKRIRNASMLAIVGSAGPAPQKQDPNAKTKAVKSNSDSSNSGTDSSDEEQQADELSVSFKNLNAASKGENSTTDTPEGILSVERCGSSQSVGASVAPNGLDEQVEQDLGHRFDLIEPWQLANILKSQELREQTLAVDVRGRDWVGGHIPLSINLHTSEVLRQPESLVGQCLRNRIHHLIFTCMYSVVRARKSALAVEQAQNDAQKAGLQTYRIKISLLAGGVHAWVNHFIRISPQKSLVKDFDPECWSDGGPAQGGLVHVMDALWSSGGQKALSDALTAELSALATLRGNGDASVEGSRRQSSEHSRRASAENSRRASEDTSKLTIADSSGAANIAGAAAAGSRRDSANDANGVDQACNKSTSSRDVVGNPSAHNDAAEAIANHNDHDLGAAADRSGDVLQAAEDCAYAPETSAEARQECDAGDATAASRGEVSGAAPGHISECVGSTTANGPVVADVPADM